MFTARASTNLPPDDDPEFSLCGLNANVKLNRPVASILRTFPTLEESGGIWPVRIQTLGVFSLTDNRMAVSSGSDCERQVLEFLKALITFGGIEVSPGDLASALWPEADGVVAQRTVDDLIEDLYRRLMVCYLETHSIGEGLSVYERCRNVLSVVLGVQPEPETEVLHHALMGAILGKNSA